MIRGRYVLGKNRIDLSNLDNFKKLFKSTGIDHVYRASSEETTFSLSLKAINKIKKQINLSKIESIIFISQSPTSTIPPTSSLVHKSLKLPLNCFTLDMIQGCSAFPYAFFFANRYIKEKIFKNCLIISAEVYGKYIDAKNRSCHPIFSDAASVIYIDNKSPIDILSEVYFADGEGCDKLFLNNNKKLFMDGPAVFDFTSKIVPKAIKKLLNTAKISIDEIDSFYIHQASKIVIDNIQQKLNIPRKKIIKSAEKFGNTVSSTIPILISEMLIKKKIKKKKLIMILGFGVGYSLSGGVFRFV